jgi:hypothetical protein
MKTTFLALLVAMLYLLHQDFWNWRAAKPLLFGFLPVGLWYHALYSLCAAGLMVLLKAVAWPDHLEDGTRGADEEDGR